MYLDTLTTQVGPHHAHDLSAEITKKCYSAQTALLIAAAAGAILVEICCPMQVTAAGRTSGPQGARGTPPLMRPVGFVCAQVVRKSAGLGAFWCGRRPPRMPSMHTSCF